MAGANAINTGIQRYWLLGAAVAIVALLITIADQGGRLAVLFVIGLALGVSLYHGAFGFASAYRNVLKKQDFSAIAAHLVMLGAAIVLFAPVLAAGTFLGRPVGGAVAPVSVGMIFGAFLFGIGMQLGSGCASGTLYSAGGGSPRMILVLMFFCVGGFWASLHLPAWQELPGVGAVSLADLVGWPGAVAAQLSVLILIWVAIRSVGDDRVRSLRWTGAWSVRSFVRGPWPLLFTAVALAVLNWLTLIVAGHPWSITWAFALWVAKAGVALGWDLATSAFWSGSFQQAALAKPVLADTVSVMNIGILLGAFSAAALAGRLTFKAAVPFRSWIAAVVGGVLMGYGARLAYGCNIGAFFSGIASASLHGWVWIVAAFAGTVIGVRLRPWFALRD
jgi:uncharacterized membrane protein YedE/YeeE